MAVADAGYADRHGSRLGGVLVVVKRNLLPPYEVLYSSVPEWTPPQPDSVLTVTPEPRRGKRMTEAQDKRIQQLRQERGLAQQAEKAAVADRDKALTAAKEAIAVAKEEVAAAVEKTKVAESERDGIRRRAAADAHAAAEKLTVEKERKPDTATSAAVKQAEERADAAVAAVKVAEAEADGVRRRAAADAHAEGVKLRLVEKERDAAVQRARQAE